MRLLLLEDDGALAGWIRRGLAAAGHVTDVLADGREALAAAAVQDYDVLILDRMVPGLDGLSVLKSLRAAQCNTPVLFLTAMGDVDDRVAGLEAGGDDYLAKPFAFTELHARIMALSRRTRSTEPVAATVLRGGGLELDLLKRRCTREGRLLDLNSKEFLLLETLLRNKGRVMTRAMLLERVWDIHFDPTTSVVETHMSRLRAKIDKPFDSPLIRTVRGAGYRFDG